MAQQLSMAPQRQRQTPRLVGLRDTRNRLELWRWSRETGRVKIVTSPCPDCESPIEVGNHALLPGVWNLTVEMLRREGGPMMDLEEHGERFIEHVIANLPADRPWSVDGCEIRAWIENNGVVVPFVAQRRRYEIIDPAGRVTLR